jgi:hypothetical protein
MFGSSYSLKGDTLSGVRLALIHAKARGVWESVP